MGRTVTTVIPLIAAAAAVTLVAGCASANTASAPGTPPAPTPAASSVEAPPTLPSLGTEETSAEPTPSLADVEIQEAATRYLAAREDAISYTHASPRDWLAQARPVMTNGGWQRLSSSVGDRGGFPAATARAHTWKVNVTVLCEHNPDAGPATNTAVTLTCTLTDRTTDAAGVPIPTKDLPRIWAYDGPQPPALLALRKVRGRWLVDADETGEAG